ncbi:hypothetical protein CPAV1605_942 [seawater metagenome]|uniref:Uncharacterized protein n=1 Tax=seawater metagenome TaxID=1561972 RepID=A0A5E8CJK3_9ZZZZ
MSINLNKVKNISGPVSVVSLNGEINGNKKKIVLFGDYHYPMVDQNECKDYDSISIKQYLINVFKDTDKPIDFFLEISPSMFETVKQEDKSYVDIYLNNLRYFFVNEMQNPSFKNVRYQYSDIRKIIYTILHDFLTNNATLENIVKYRNIYDTDIEFLIEKANIVSDSINIIIKALKSNLEEFNKMIQEASEEKKFYMKNIRKIVFNYNHQEVKDQIRQILKIIIVGIKESMQKIINQLKKIQKNKAKKKYSYYDLDKAILKLSQDLYRNLHMTSGFYVMLTDLYTVRRMLDKNYINTAVFYGGAQHMTDILNILVNNFGFNVIDKFSQQDLLITIDRQYFNKYYKEYNQDYLDEKEYYILNQCVDVSNFKKPII